MAAITPVPTPDPILIGTSWYPEMWPEAEWDKDLARMRELGFRIVRVFEFAWHRLEPKPGQFDFDWALKVMDLCHAAGIVVMAGTPTAAPPAWLTYGYPDVLRVEPDGRRASHGQRKHYSVFSRRYREFVRRIVSEMARRFAGHPALHSWQIDNEMGGRDFSDEAVASFHAWLQRKYTTIENLNRTWGLEFWSQAYQSFDQVPLVQGSEGSVEVPERHHPSLIMAVTRHLNDAWSDFISFQCGLIRAHSDKPITTNMTPGLGMHWYQHNRVLDRVGFSMYRDVLHYHWNVMNFDRMRAEKDGAEPRVLSAESSNAAGSATSAAGPQPSPQHSSLSTQHYVPYWLLETAPSWSAGGKMWNIHHDAAGITAMSFLSLLLGGSMVLFWQWRSHWAGQEMQHGTLVTATGQWSVNREAMVKLCADAAAQEAFLQANPPRRAGVGLVLSHENAWAFGIDPVDEAMRYDVRWRDDFHIPLLQNHLWRDVISEDHDFSPYKVLILPHMPMVKETTRARLRAWVEAGGRLLLGPLTGYRTEEFTAFTDRTFGGLEDLIGATSALRFTVHWVEDRVQIAFADGRACKTRNWCEAFAPTTGTALAHYRGGYGDGLPAVMDHALGKGRVITCGCKLSDELYVAMVRHLMNEVGLAPLAAGSKQVVVVPRGENAWGLVNLAESPQEITLAGGRPMTLAPLEWRIV